MDNRSGFTRIKSAVTLLVIVASVACTDATQRSIEKAQSFEAAGQLAEAAIELRSAIAAAPDDVDGNYRLGLLLAKVGNLVDAEVLLRKAMKLGKPAGEVAPVLGAALIERERYADALDLLGQVGTDLSPEAVATIAVLRGRAHLGKGALVEARTQFQVALAGAPAAARIGLLMLSLAANDHSQVDAEVGSMPKSHPADSAVWMAVGDIQRVRGNRTDAIAAYRKAAEIAPKDAAPVIGEATLELWDDRLPEAKSLIERAEKLAPLKPSLEFARALLAYKEKRQQDCAMALQRLLAVVPTYGPGLMLAGVLNYSTEQFELARNSFGAYLASDPGNVFVRRMLAATLLAQGRPREAERVVDVAGGKEDAQLLVLKARVKLAMGQPATAIGLLQRAATMSKADADVLANLGLSYLAAGQRTKAKESFEASIAAGAKNARPDHALAMMYLAEQQVDQASRVVDRLALRIPDSFESHMLRGAVETSRQSYAEARKNFERARKQDPMSIPAIEALADLDRREGKSDSLRERLEAIVAKDSKHIDALLLIARLDAAEGKGEQAAGRIRQVLTEQPRSLSALLILGRIQLESGNPRDAITTARRASDEHPWDSRTLDLLADAQLAARDVEGARVTLDRLAELRPDSAGPLLRIAALTAASGDPRGALSRLRELTRRFPSDLSGQVLLGDVYLQMNRYDDALAQAHIVQQRAPKFADGHRLEGDVRMAKGDPVRAVRSFELALGSSSSGSLLIRSHQAQVAAKVSAPTARLEAWVARNPRDPAVRLYLGDYFAETKRFDAATEQYNALLASSPNDFRVLNNLAWVMHQRQDKGALEVARKASSLSSGDSRVLDTLGLILLQTPGGASEAVQVLLQASAAAPGNSQIRFHLAQALAAVGDKQRAIKELETAIAGGAFFADAQLAREMIAGLKQ